MVANKKGSTSETFVLVHGSWHGGWAWQVVIRYLSAKGHHPHAPIVTDDRLSSAADIEDVPEDSWLSHDLCCA